MACCEAQSYGERSSIVSALRSTRLSVQDLISSWTPQTFRGDAQHADKERGAKIFGFADSSWLDVFEGKGESSKVTGWWVQ